MRAVTEPDERPKPGSALLIVGIMVVAANMRPLATSLGPLLHQIRHSEHLSGASAGLLTTIPVLCFGAVAAAAAPLTRRFGIAVTITLVLVAIIAGLLVRVSGGVGLLFAGTMLAAAGAACGNVLLPVVVRRSFADRVGRISALYTTALVGCASLAAGVAVPLASVIGHGWRGGLAIWAVPAAIALLVWLPQLRRDGGRPPPVSSPHAVSVRRLTREPLTWHLTVFFAMQSWGFYATLAWLPSIFQSHGLSSTTAGLLLGLSSIMAVPAALIIPGLAIRFREQGPLAVGMSIVAAGGYAGLLAAPAAAPALWAVLIGLGQGGAFPLVLTMIVLRSGSAQLTASLSAHVQGGGYLIAAAGPFIVGALHDATGSWSLSVIVLIAILVPQALSGIGAGRPRTLAERLDLAGQPSAM
jgi:CP family cyanate transporter-like MFS transporter